MYDCIERKRMPVKGKSGKNTSDMIPVMFSCLILFAVPCLLARINMAASETLPRNTAQGTSVPAEDDQSVQTGLETADQPDVKRQPGVLTGTVETVKAEMDPALFQRNYEMGIRRIRSYGNVNNGTLFDELSRNSQFLEQYPELAETLETVRTYQKAIRYCINREYDEAAVLFESVHREQLPEKLRTQYDIIMKIYRQKDALADQYNTPDSVFYHRDVLPEVHINQDYLTNQYDYGIACFLWGIYGQAASIFDQLYYTAIQPVYINHPLFSEHSTYEYLNLDLLASSMTFHISGNYSRSYETLKLIDPEPLPADLKAIYALHRDFFSTLIERDAKNTTQNIKKPIQYYEEPEDLYEYYDDPFDVDYYSSPEEFYEDHKNDFRSFKDAEDYFYEYGYW